MSVYLFVKTLYWTIQKIRSGGSFLKQVKNQRAFIYITTLSTNYISL